MKQTILRYGLLSGITAAVLMIMTALFVDFDHGAYFGFAGIFLSMLFIFFGIRSYREQVGNGELSFGKGFQIGLLIAIISCVCYVLAWMFVSDWMMPDFMEQYVQHTMTKMQESGASALEIEKANKEMEHLKEMYKNPLVKFGLTFIEPFPVGFFVALVSALILKKRDS